MDQIFRQNYCKLSEKAKLVLIFPKRSLKMRLSKSHANSFVDGRAWAFYPKMRLSKSHANSFADGRAWAFYPKMRLSKRHANSFADGRAWAFYLISRVTALNILQVNWTIKCKTQFCDFLIPRHNLINTKLQILFRERRHMCKNVSNFVFCTIFAD